MKNLMSKIGMKSKEPIYHPWLNKSIERAQKKVEERNFEIRKHLLEYDDVLNQQRKFIYEQRDAILSDGNLKDRIHETTRDMVNRAMETFRNTLRRGQQEAFQELVAYLKTQFNYILPLDITEPGMEKPKIGRSSNPEQIQEQIILDLEQDISDKAALIGENNLNYYIRMQYLQSIDRKWLDHLENMESLREAVYLRGYAQKNPLTEYKIEGFQIFDTMIDTIREEIASRFHLIRFQTIGSREVRGPVMVHSTSHGAVGAFESGQSDMAQRANTQKPSTQALPEGATVVRNYPKVGRNDPCPCGSGKKYKFCHGR